MVAEHDITITLHPAGADRRSGADGLPCDLSVWFDRDPSRKVGVVVSVTARPDDQLELEGSDIRDVMNQVRVAPAMWSEMYASDDAEPAPRPRR